MTRAAKGRKKAKPVPKSTPRRRGGGRPPVHSHCCGGRPSLTYNSWRAMKERCLNPRHLFYYLYGGRGIGVCLRWLFSFEAFLEDMGERPSRLHSLDRIDGDLGYQPGNCRWATAREQWENLRPDHEIDWEF